ncbi:MAG TPA: phage portal protein, partial [Desulfobacterales bacterium]|nr:phage portal protein [Desulfobacterales bacterium]
MRWPWKQKSKKPVEVKDSYTGDISIDAAIDLISKELGSIGGASEAGPTVNESTAMNFSAVYACVSLLAGTIASLPFEVFKDNGNSDLEIDKTHPAFKLINSEPNQAMTAYVFWETIGTELFLNGNAYAIISRKPNGNPDSVWWLPQKTVTPFFNPEKTRIWYRVNLGSHQPVFDQDDILHFPCIGWDGLQGKSPIKHARESIGLGLAGENFNSKYFTNAITSNIHIGYPKPLSPDAQIKLKAYLMARNTGENKRSPLVTMDDAKVTSLQMNADDAQMMASRVFQIEDICRFYGVPLHLVSSTEKSTSWGTGIEQQTIGFIMFSFRKRVKMIEQEVNRKLIRSETGYSKLNLSGLLRGDAAARGAYYNIMRGGNQLPGIMATNEIRKVEGLKPLSDPKYDLP